VAEPRQTWVDVQNVSRADLDVLARTFRIPAHVLESKLFQDAFPGVDYFRDYTILVLWDVRLVEAPEDPCGLATDRRCLVVICAQDYLATLCAEPNGMFENLVERGLPMAGESFSVRVLYAILRQAIGDYQRIVQTLEQRVADMEEVPGRTAPPAFLEETFHLKKVIQKQDYNLRHFAQALGHISAHKVILAGIHDGNQELFALVRDEADTLAETCRSVRENLLSLIELQLNKVSFDLNRVMRVLAVITCLALIPGIVGGLLGENLIDQPFNVTIHEVFFVVMASMVIGLYVFYRKGWMK
jgi:Mg2+ and Co2+ transporter CorA